MRVYVIPPQAVPFGTYLDGSVGNDLYELQAMVGGYIEPCAPAELRAKGIELLCNEEGLLSQLPININMFPFLFVGPLVAVGIGDEDFVSLTPEQETYLKKWLENLP